MPEKSNNNPGCFFKIVGALVLGGLYLYFVNLISSTVDDPAVQVVYIGGGGVIVLGLIFGIAK